MSNNDEWRNSWNREIDNAKEIIKECPHPSLEAADALDIAMRLLSLARIRAGNECKECHGTTEKMYGSTALWNKGSVGGQAMTAGVCDICWGSGRSDLKYGDQRLLRQICNSNLDKTREK